MRRFLIVLLMAAPLTAADAELLKNGGIKGPAAWNRTPGAPTVTFKVDRKVGASKRGSLYIANTNASDKMPHNWRQTVSVPVGRPYRLKLSAMVKTKGMEAGSEAEVMLQLLPKEGAPVGYARCAEVRADTDWTELYTVFDVPENCERVFMMAYLVGKGEVWFDDFSIRKTDEPLTEAPSAGNTKLWSLVRSCAEEIDWLFDAGEAKKRARKERKPILVYVRCVDDEKNLADAQSSLRAEKIAARDDGLRKDVLFRAGPLSDPDVTAVIEASYVPLLLTYRLGTHGQGQVPATDPLRRVGAEAKDVVTPGLLVVDAKGKLKRKLHRIGTMSTDLVDHWLRADLGAKADLGKLARKKKTPLLVRVRAHTRLGELEAAEKLLGTARTAAAALERGRIALRRGDWAKALTAFEAAGKDEEVRFWRAWCLQRLGRHKEAADQWKALAGKTRFGRRAAACVLPDGPHLWLSMSERTWPRGRNLPEQTEGGDEAAFDPEESVRVLLELQNADGSFGTHRGSNGFGAIDAAVTAFASEALWLWRDHLPKPLGRRADEAHQRALAWFTPWSKRRTTGTDVWNDPYVLMHLAQLRHDEPVERLVARIAKSQMPDGNWTVYVRDRPASFNTALNVMALAKAKAARWKVPEDVMARGAKALAAMLQEGDLFPYSTKKGHEWMTTEHGSIARDALCEHVLLLTKGGSKQRLGKALGRYMEFGHELRAPTKKYYDYFNSRGHGGYYYFFAHRNAFEACEHVGRALREKTRKYVRETVLAAREGDGAFMDHAMNGRAYGTAQALVLLAPR